MESIAEHEAELTAYALSRLSGIRRIKIYGDTNPKSSATRLGVIPFNIEGRSHFLAAAILGAEWGIGVRNGCFCAHPYLLHLMALPEKETQRARADILANDRHDMPGMVRVSFGMYNTTGEVDILAEALTEIAHDHYEGRYEQDRRTGEYYAVGWKPDLREYFKL